MAEITISLIKALRDATGIGMKACQKALEEAQGDMEQAITNLRKSGMAAAVKKQDRETNEGVIVFAENADRLALVEVNAETDFVVRNEKFNQFAKDIAEEVAETNPSSLEDFLAQKYSKDHQMTIEEYRANIVQTIGENIQIKRIKVIQKDSHKSVGVYSHLGGKIVAAVEIEGANSEQDLAKELAIHATASAPLFLSPQDVSPEIINSEKDIAKSQMAGKPDNIVDKIIQGKLQAYYKENCLIEQPFFKDEKKSVSEILDLRGKEIGKTLKLKSFERWSIKK